MAVNRPTPNRKHQTGPGLPVEITAELKQIYLRASVDVTLSRCLD